MRMGSRVRRVALFVHVTLAVGWIGAVAAYLALDVTVATTGNVHVLRSSWTAMGIITDWVIVPLAFWTFMTGLIMALGTKWGLFRHWWVVVTLVLTLVAMLVLAVESEGIRRSAASARDPQVPDDNIRALPNTLPHSVGALIVLMTIQALNMYKPRGLTKYGWKKQQEESSEPNMTLSINA